MTIAGLRATARIQHHPPPIPSPQYLRTAPPRDHCPRSVGKEVPRAQFAEEQTQMMLWEKGAGPFRRIQTHHQTVANVMCADE